MKAIIIVITVVVVLISTQVFVDRYIKNHNGKNEYINELIKKP